jgi:hypothetical protein
MAKCRDQKIISIMARISELKKELGWDDVPASLAKDGVNAACDFLEAKGRICPDGTIWGVKRDKCESPDPNLPIAPSTATLEAIRVAPTTDVCTKSAIAAMISDGKVKIAKQFLRQCTTKLYTHPSYAKEPMTMRDFKMAVCGEFPKAEYPQLPDDRSALDPYRRWFTDKCKEKLQKAKAQATTTQGKLG